MDRLHLFHRGLPGRRRPLSWKIIIAIIINNQCAMTHLHVELLIYSPLRCFVQRSLE